MASFFGISLRNDSLLSTEYPYLNQSMIFNRNYSGPAVDASNTDGDGDLYLWSTVIVRYILISCGGLSLICTLVVLGNFLFKKTFYKLDANRLISFMAIADLVMALAFIFLSFMPFLPEQYRMSLCLLQALLFQFGSIASAMWASSQAISLMIILYAQKSQVSTTKYEKFYYFISFGVSFLMAFILLFINVDGSGGDGIRGGGFIYGYVDPICWIRNDFRWIQVGVFYAPILLIFAATLILYIVCGVKVYERARSIKAATAVPHQYRPPPVRRGSLSQTGGGSVYLNNGTASQQQQQISDDLELQQGVEREHGGTFNSYTNSRHPSTYMRNDSHLSVNYHDDGRQKIGSHRGSWYEFLRPPLHTMSIWSSISNVSMNSNQSATSVGTSSQQPCGLITRFYKRLAIYIFTFGASYLIPCTLLYGQTYLGWFASNQQLYVSMRCVAFGLFALRGLINFVYFIMRPSQPRSSSSQDQHYNKQ
ncbi:hypothetical protein MIR68_011646 [Amoeboaphelidium protococcarum]|nr:hypothetical protein MIR68_011646 [Amoeboaphelidium protococcarum]